MTQSVTLPTIPDKAGSENGLINNFECTQRKYPPNLDAKIVKANSLIECLLKQHTVVSSTKFDSDSIAFLHFINAIAPNIPIIWVDTGYNSHATIEFANQATNHLGLNLHVFKPATHSNEMPPSIDDQAHEAFAEKVKMVPFRQALKSLRATCWVSSVRSYQTPNRKALPIELKLSPQLTKVHPMLAWTEADIQAYQNKYNLPTGPIAYDPTKGHRKAECGLHKVSTFFK